MNIVNTIKKILFPYYNIWRNRTNFKNALFPEGKYLNNLLDYKIRYHAAKLLSLGNRFRMYQPIPFKEFSDIVPSRSRACNNRWKEISKHLPENMSGLSILDLGAAEGYFGLQCAKRGAQVTAVEFFPEKSNLIRLISRKYKFKDFMVISKDISKLDLKSLGEYDFVFYLNIHQHIYKINPSAADRILTEIGGICKKSIFFETRAFKFSQSVEKLNLENPQPFLEINNVLDTVKKGANYTKSEELFYEGFDEEPNNTDSSPTDKENIYRLFKLSTQ